MAHAYRILSEVATPGDVGGVSVNRLLSVNRLYGFEQLILQNIPFRRMRADPAKTPLERVKKVFTG